MSDAVAPRRLGRQHHLPGIELHPLPGLGRFDALDASGVGVSTSYRPIGEVAGDASRPCRPWTASYSQTVGSCDGPRMPALGPSGVPDLATRRLSMSNASTDGIASIASLGG
jgi:hypothetical protein